MHLLSLLSAILLSASLPAGTKSASAEPQIMTRTYVPNAMLAQGEVRLVRRGDETIVQTVLDTRFETRVKNSIVKKERLNWREHPDATAYVTALGEAVEEYQHRKAYESKRVGMTIDFIDGPDTARVDFSFPEVSRDRQGFRVNAAAVWLSIALSGEYIRANQEYIIADAFKKHAPAWLERLRACRTPGDDEGHE